MNPKRHLRCLFSGLLAVSALFTVGVSQSYAEDPAVAAALTKMEDRLLEHDYHTESDDSRLNRLEKFVFGGPETGTTQARVARLNAAIVPAPESESVASAPSGKSSGKSPVATAGGVKPAAQPKPSGATGAYLPSDYGSYPRVAELEQQVFGKTFESEALPVRIARLETKEFGKPSKEDDLCDRLDKLDQLVLPTTPNRVNTPRYAAPAAPNMMAYGMPGAGSGYSRGSDDEDSPPPKPENPFAPGQAQVKGVELRTSTLEKFVFGHEHFGKPLAERVQRLEKKLVPYEHQSDKDIATRVDHLWTMLSAANTMNNSSTD